MKVRAVTLGCELPTPHVAPDALAQEGAFLRSAVAALGAAGYEVQTTRLAGPALGPALGALGEARFAEWAHALEDAVRGAGIGYLSLGQVPGSRPDVVEHLVAPLLAAGSTVFLSADLLEGGRPSIRMARACAAAVRALAASTPLGFGNLRFAATAGCPPNIPFFPASYHAGGPPRFALAVEAADLVLDVLAGPGPVEALEERLVQRLEEAVRPIEQVADALAAEAGHAFVGIDLSPAPYPTAAVSIGGALEAAGVDHFGAPGTLYLAAMVTRAIRRTRLRRSGFSGLMLPVLEDTMLAQRLGERPLGLHALLLYSAVCGTGLDTVPIPGDTAESQLVGIFLDVAALSVALGGKPLTARLLPVPGARAGDPTAYDFEFFANSRVLPLDGGAAGILERER